MTGGPPTSPSLPSFLSIWQPPQPKVIKVNMDVACYKGTGRGAIRIVARGSSGQLLLAISYSFPIFGLGVLHLKTLALF